MSLSLSLALPTSFNNNNDNNNDNDNNNNNNNNNRENYRPISITPILSKVYEKLVSHKLSNYARNMVFCLLLSLLIGKVWAAIMHCLPYLVTFRSS